MNLLNSKNYRTPLLYALLLLFALVLLRSQNPFVQIVGWLVAIGAGANLGAWGWRFAGALRAERERLAEGMRRKVIREGRRERTQEERERRQEEREVQRLAAEKTEALRLEGLREQQETMAQLARERDARERKVAGEVRRLEALEGEELQLEMMRLLALRGWQMRLLGVESGSFWLEGEGANGVALMNVVWSRDAQAVDVERVEAKRVESGLESAALVARGFALEATERATQLRVTLLDAYLLASWAVCEEKSEAR